MKKFAMPLIALSLLNGVYLFGDGDNASQEMVWSPNGVPPRGGFNSPARIEVNGAKDVFITANFIYWNPIQENMEVGIVTDLSDPIFATNGHVIKQDFGYTPGFQIGIGGNLSLDKWDIFGQYTWVRNTDNTSVSLDPAGTDALIPLLLKPESTNPTFLKGESHWRLSMDIGDIELGRSYYTGSALTFRPFVGIRTAFIRQHLKAEYEIEVTGFNNSVNEIVTQRSHSWGVGPRAGLGMNWLLGHNVRMYGNGSADILFTQYTTLKWEQYGTSAAGVIIPGTRSRIEEENLNYLRTHLALELGFGWGDYFRDGKYHFDFSAGYGFQVFFNQNMFREFSDGQTWGSSVPNGDLFIHGLTVATRFDF